MNKIAGDENQTGLSKRWLLVVVGFSAAAVLVRWAGLVIPIIGTSGYTDPRGDLCYAGGGHSRAGRGAGDRFFLGIAGCIGCPGIKFTHGPLRQRVVFRLPVQAGPSIMAYARSAVELDRASCGILLYLTYWSRPD